MVLSDKSIKEELANGRIKIDPLGESCIQPASVDVHLDKEILVYVYFHFAGRVPRKTALTKKYMSFLKILGIWPAVQQNNILEI